jgi:predicted MPP superfamily phosphohydrolase
MSYQLREVTVPVLPAGHRSIRVLHFSDLHLTPKRKVEIADIKSFADLKPDLVISTGDFLAHKDAVSVVLDALHPLFDIPGLFVFGSNDYFGPKPKNPFSYLFKDNGKRKLGPDLDWEGLQKSLTGIGWLDLNHSREIIKINDTTIEARGTDDAHLSFDNYSEVAGLPDKKADLAIGVTHAPYLRILDAMSKDNLDLIFAGHTHGGQICVPFYGALVTNCDLPQGQAKGFSTFGESEMPLHVSAGVGTSPFAQVRIACRPEATLITLSAKRNS